MMHFVANKLPPKFMLTNNGRNLTITNLCKDCAEGDPSDLQVIQCNASNVHGYALGTGYVNVLCECFMQMVYQQLAIIF